MNFMLHLVLENGGPQLKIACHLKITCHLVTKKLETRTDSKFISRGGLSLVLFLYMRFVVQMAASEKRDACKLKNRLYSSVAMNSNSYHGNGCGTLYFFTLLQVHCAVSYTRKLVSHEKENIFQCPTSSPLKWSVPQLNFPFRYTLFEAFWRTRVVISVYYFSLSKRSFR